MILKLWFCGKSLLQLWHTRMGLGRKTDAASWFLLSDVLFWLESSFSGGSSLCVLAVQTICFPTIRFVTYRPCYFRASKWKGSIGTACESQRHPDIPCFVSSPWSSPWNPPARPSSTGLDGTALMKLSEQLQLLQLKHMRRRFVSRGERPGVPAGRGSQGRSAGFSPHPQPRGALRTREQESARCSDPLSRALFSPKRNSVSLPWWIPTELCPLVQPSALGSADTRFYSPSLPC